MKYIVYTKSFFPIKMAMFYLKRWYVNAFRSLPVSDIFYRIAFKEAVEIRTLRQFS